MTGLLDAVEWVLERMKKKTMQLKLQRLHDNGESTLGILYMDGEFYCYTLEDPNRADKVKGKTRIPAGEYPISLRKVDSPLTQKYQGDFDWFTYHLELQNVPNFDYIYIHLGNTPSDTSGCVLIGNGQQLAPQRMVTHSRDAYEDFYKKAKPKAKSGHLTIKIENECDK